MKKVPLPRVPRVFTKLIGQPITLYHIHPLSQRTNTVRGSCVAAVIRKDGTHKLPALGIKPEGKPIVFTLMRPDTLVFRGQAPVQSDVEASKCRRAAASVYPSEQNGCLNLVGDPAPLRAFLGRNLNKAFAAFDRIIAVRHDDNGAGLIIRRRQLPVFPEVPTTHAVVKRIRDEARATPDNRTIGH
jgi:hypothetical protein